MHGDMSSALHDRLRELNIEHQGKAAEAGYSDAQTRRHVQFNLPPFEMTEVELGLAAIGPQSRSNEDLARVPSYSTASRSWPHSYSAIDSSLPTYQHAISSPEPSTLQGKVAKSRREQEGAISDN